MIRHPKKKLNFCKLSWNQAYYLCHIILSDPTYGLVVSTVVHSETTCVEEPFQFHGIEEDVEKRQKSYKFQMYTCPPTSDARHGRTYALGPVDGATPTLAVLRLESRTYEYYVDARVTDINLEVLASLREMDFRQINERIQKQTEEK